MVESGADGMGVVPTINETGREYLRAPLGTPIERRALAGNQFRDSSVVQA
jgi:hypothetical protein